MLTLSHLPPPPPKNEVTACENEGQLRSFPSEEAKVKIHEWLGNYIVEVSIGQENARSAYSKYEAKEAFSAHNETLWQRLVAAYYEEGAVTAFQHLSQEEVSDTNPLLRKGANLILKLMESFEKFKYFLYSPSRTPMHVIDASIQGSSGLITTLAWHPHTSTLAVAYTDDTIRVFGKNRSLTPLLKHRLQKQIIQMEWMPYCASILAVGCQSGIVLWTLDPISVVTRPSGSCLSSLSHPATLPITSLSWHPKGVTIACVGGKGRELVVWDSASEDHCTVHSGIATCISKVSWSPDGNRLLAAMSSPAIMVFETRNWSFEKWSLSYPLESAVWSKCGKIMLFATTKEPFLFSLSFSDDEEGVCGAVVATQVADLSACIHSCQDEEVRVGGLVKELAWDRRSERLAVVFKDCEFIALFHTQTHPQLHLAPGGFIRGESGQHPLHTRFQCNVPNGSILTTVWSGGEVKHLPLRYTSHKMLDEFSSQIPVVGNRTLATSPLGAGNISHSRVLNTTLGPTMTSPVGSPLPRLFTSPS